MERGLGLIDRDPPRPAGAVQDYVYRPLGSALPVRATGRRWELIQEFLNQGWTNRCTAFAPAYVIQVLEALAGLPYDPISENDLYYHSRCFHAGEREDFGSYNRTTCKAMARFGVAPRSKWPDSTETINEQPPSHVRMRAHARAGGRYELVPGEGESRLEASHAVIAENAGIVIGMRVTSAYDNAGSATVPPPRADEPYRGLHAIAIIDFDEQGRAISPSSWGRGHGDGGLVALDPGWLSSPLTFDVRAIYGWRRLQQAAAAGAGRIHALA